MDRSSEEYQAIDIAREQWRNNPSNADPWQAWGHLRTLLYARFEQRHCMQDLEEIIQTDLRLLCGTTVPSSNLAAHVMRLFSLAVAYSDREKRTLAPSDNARALYFRRLALAILPEGSKNLRAVIRSQLALSLLTKADNERSSALMDEAYTYAAAALASNLDHDSIEKREQIDTLANVLRQRYLLSGDPRDLDRSIDLLEQEVGLNFDNLAGAFHNLSYSLALRHKLSGNALDLNRAIELAFKAIEDPKITLESFVDRARNLVDFLSERFDRYAEVTDILRAKKLLESAIHKLSPESSRFSALCGSLSRLLRKSYESSSRLEDLNAAIKIARDGLAVQRLPLKTKRSLENELGLLLTNRYRRLGQNNDGHEALQYLRSALDSVTSSEPSWSVVLSNLATVYSDLYQSTNEVEYLKEAQKVSLKAIAASDVKGNSSLWLNTANGYIRLYTADGRQIEHLSQGIKIIHEGLGATQKWQSRVWAQMCLSAGILYDLKYQRSGEAEDFSSALVMFLETWSFKPSPLELKLRAITLACDLLVRGSRWLEAWLFLQDAVKLIPLYCASSPNYQDQQYKISDVFGTTALACAAGLVVGETVQALEIWEQGRGIIVSSSYHGIGELVRLKNEHPRLHETFNKRIAAIFETSDTAYESSTSLWESAHLRRDQIELESRALLDEVVQEIRNCEGFESFLRPITATQMQTLAGEGAIVVLNSSKYRTHAILVTKSRIDCIDLSDPLEKQDIFRKFGQIYNTAMQDRPNTGQINSLSMSQRNKNMRVVLYGLWQYVVKPVCDALDFTTERMSKNINELPPNIDACRIRWLTSGVFSRLPLHAAGIWSGPGNEVLVKMSISSYAASFRILEFAAQRSKDVEEARLRGVIVSMERPPADVPYMRKKMFLKNAQREREEIQAVKGRIEWTSLIRPSAQRVLYELPKYAMVHFATHGISDAKDPSRSHLVLMNAAESNRSATKSETLVDRVVSDKLFVTDLFRCTADNAILAFLAACSTADAQVEKLADENLHIGNAFQIAGFPHVIGTLWPVNEVVCPIFAKNFYDQLNIWTDSGNLRNELIAFAVHTATVNLINLYKDEPLLWACFVHIGP